jgi:hypothetical protein
VKHCKAAVALDKNNYNVWVFSGLSLFYTEKELNAEQAYQKAIEIDPANPAAYKVKKLKAYILGTF